MNPPRRAAACATSLKLVSLCSLLAEESGQNAFTFIVAASGDQPCYADGLQESQQRRL